MRLPWRRESRTETLPPETGRVIDMTAGRRGWGHNIEFFAAGAALGWGASPREGDIILHEFRSDATGEAYVARLLVLTRGWMDGVDDGWRITYRNLGPREARS